MSNTIGGPPSVKHAARTEALRRRRQLVGERDAAADEIAIASHLTALIASLRLGGGVVAAYESFGTEPRTQASIDSLLNHGIQVLVPITLSDNDLDWRDVTDPNRMPQGPDAIRRASVIVVPGLAADHNATRLGRGGASYDRALARRGSTSITLIALHPGEISGASLPRETHDQPVDGALTADGITWLGRPIPGVRRS